MWLFVHSVPTRKQTSEINGLETSAVSPMRLVRWGITAEADTRRWGAEKVEFPSSRTQELEELEELPENQV
jgi:hypothetical protein